MGRPSKGESERIALSHNPSSSIAVVCPMCEEKVGAQRFAPHLEKCVNGGGRKVSKKSAPVQQVVSLAPTKSATEASVLRLPIAQAPAFSAADAQLTIVQTQPLEIHTERNNDIDIFHSSTPI